MRSVGARGVLFATLAFAVATHLALVRRNLPYTPEVDEPDFVVRGIGMAGRRSLDPGWFGHPGSTVFHPLAAVLALRQLVIDRHLADATRLAAAFDADPAPFYLAGRALTVAYSLGALVLLERLGRRTFGGAVGTIAALVLAVSPLVVAHATMVRTDSACVFFSILALGACIELARAIGPRAAARAGCALGLALATKYSLAALGAVLVAALVLPPAGSAPPSVRRRLSALAVALVTAAIVFVATTPYLFVHFAAAREHIAGELRTAHPGADALSPGGNLRWYLLSALPAELSWPALGLASVGIAAALRSEPRTAALSLVMIVAVLAEIALHPLHWARWLLPVLPPLALFVALGATRGAALLAGGGRTRCVTLAALVALAVASPTRNLVRLALQQREPSTRVAARAWVMANVPSGAGIAQEWYTAALDRRDFLGYGHDRVLPVRSPRDGWWAMLWQREYLAEDADLDTYRRRRIDYVVTSSTIRDRYAADPARHASELAFYAHLDAEAHLVGELRPSTRRAGPTIRVYRLAPPAAKGEGR